MLVLGEGSVAIEMRKLWLYSLLWYKPLDMLQSNVSLKIYSSFKPTIQHRGYSQPWLEEDVSVTNGAGTQLTACNHVSRTNHKEM